MTYLSIYSFFFSSRRRHTSSTRDWSSDVCSSDLAPADEKLPFVREGAAIIRGQVSGVSRTAEAKYIQLGGRIGKTLQVRSEYRALAAFHRQTGSREECEKRAA